MALSSIISEAKNVFEGVTGHGIVHEYERWSKNWSTLLNLFKDSNSRINGLTISRKGTAQRQATIGEVEKAHVLRIQAVYGLNDADGSETTFQSLLEDYVAAFNDDDNKTLNNTCLTIDPDWGPMENAVGLQIDDVTTRIFGTVLCHHADMRLCAIETISV